ncbi:hypothetical protein DL96DRAFT_1705323 [Flagelloscypha sp. PMI_526]|nr:hypothetical protein DL96DRAFT_1705323 [Flagelloscypha sp. PMI_526]
MATPIENYEFDREESDDEFSKRSIAPTVPEDDDEDILLPTLETSFILQLSSHPFSATYTHIGSGEVIYQIETPRLRFLPPLSTIKRFTPSGPIVVAKLHRPSVLGSSKYFEFPLQDKTIQATQLFRKGGWSHYGHDRVFTLPNGKEVKWAMELTKSKLYLNNPEKTVVVNFRAWKPKFLHKDEPDRKVTFQIFPQPLFDGLEAEDAASIGKGAKRLTEEQFRVLDWIMATFVLVEGVRMARR